MNQEIERCQRVFAKSVEWRRKQLKRELKKLDEVKLFAEEAFDCMNSPPISAADSLWTAIQQQEELHDFEFVELVYRGDLEKDFEAVEAALSSDIKYRMQLFERGSRWSGWSEDDDFNLIEALAANTVATPAAKTTLRQIAAEYKKALAGKRKRYDCRCDLDCDNCDATEEVEYGFARRILALLLESPEFSRLVAHVYRHKHLLPKE